MGVGTGGAEGGEGATLTSVEEAIGHDTHGEGVGRLRHCTSRLSSRRI
jgi:hypothetical protein